MEKGAEDYIGYRRRAEMKRGGVLRTILILILIAIIIIYGGYPPFISYMSYLSIKERCKELARFAKMYKSTEDIKNKVIEKINEEGLYVRPYRVSVYYEGEKIIIRANFTDTLIWFGGYVIVPLNYKLEVKRLPAHIE